MSEFAHGARVAHRFGAGRLRRSPISHLTQMVGFALGRRGPVSSGHEQQIRCSSRGCGWAGRVGKTALVDSLCKRMRDVFNLAVVTNDIYTKEDQEFLIRSQALAPERIRGVETGGCPHTAIREDASMNLAAIDQLMHDFQGLDLIIVESGGDNLAATFSPELSDLTLYVIDVAAGDKIPRKGGPGIMKSDLLIINKIDLAPHVGSLARGDGSRCAQDARRAPVRVHQPEDGAGAGRGDPLHRNPGHAATLTGICGPG